VFLVGLLGLAYASFLFMRIILLFMFTCSNLLVKIPLGGVSEKPIMWGSSQNPMMVMSCPFSAGTLTFVRTMETFIEILCHRFFSFGEDE
jgi:hypothetical protein